MAGCCPNPANCPRAWWVQAIEGAGDATGLTDEQGGDPVTTTATGRRRLPSRSSGARRDAASPLTGPALLALALSLRARTLRGLDVLRRSQDRAPPASL
jgi:hypothetical protein